MAEVTIYPYGKPVKVKWFNPDVPPTDADIDSMVETYKRTYPQGATQTSPRNTGRMPSRLEGSIQMEIAPVDPFQADPSLKSVVQPTAKPAAKTPNTAAVAAAAMGNPAAAFSLLGGKAGKVPPQSPPPKLPKKNPNLIPKGLIPKTAQDVFDQNNTPEARAKAIQQAQEEAKRKPMASGAFDMPGVGTITWVQRGPGFEAHIPGLGLVKGGTRKQLTDNVNRAVRNKIEQDRTRAQSPNRAAYIASDDKAIPGNVQDPRTSAEQLLRTYGKLNPNDRDKRDAFNRQVEQVGSVIAQAARIGSAKNPIADTAREFAGAALADTLSSPAQIAYEANTFFNPEFTFAEQAGAFTNLAVRALTASLTPTGASLVDDLVQLFKSPAKLATALDNLHLEPNQKAAAIEFAEKHGARFKGFQNGKPVFGVKAATKEVDIDSEITRLREEAAAKRKAKQPAESPKVKASEPPRMFKNVDELTPEQIEIINSRIENPNAVHVGDKFHAIDFGHGGREAGKEFTVTGFGKVGNKKNPIEMVLLKAEDGMTTSATRESLTGRGGFWAQKVDDWQITDEYKAWEAGQPPAQAATSADAPVLPKAEQKAVQSVPTKRTPPRTPDAPKQASTVTTEAGKGKSTGLANQVTERERASGDIKGEEKNLKGQSKEELHKKGQELYRSGELDIQSTMRRLASEGRTATGVEYGAALEHKRQLLKKVNAAREAIDQAIAAKKETGRLVFDLEKLEAEVNHWQNLVDETKTAWSDAGKGLQIGTTINEGDIAEVLLERRRKLGRELTRREKATFEKQVSQLKKILQDANVQWNGNIEDIDSAVAKAGGSMIDRAKAEAVIRTSAKVPKSFKTVEAARQARKEAATRIAERIAKSTASVGAGPGQAFSQIVEALPEIVDDIKIIARSIAEEFQIRVLDKQLFDKVRENIPGVSLSDDDIVRVLAGEWDEKVKREESLFAELTRQARKENAKPLREAKAKLNADLKAAKERIRQAEKQAAERARIEAERVKDTEKQARQIEDEAMRSLREESQKKADAELKASRAQLADASRELRKLEDRLATLEDIEEQITSGGFWESVKKVDAATKVQQKLDLKIKGKRRQIRSLIRQRDETVFERQAMGYFGLARSLRLGSDAGMLLRQGLFTLGRGKANLKGLTNFFKALGDDTAWDVINESYFYKEAADGRLLEPIRSKAGLATSDVYLDPEEIRVIQLLKKVPVLSKFVGSLERGQAAFINTVRREVFDQFVEKFPDATEMELKARARFINAATGRSNWKDVPVAFQAVMTSPRYTASRYEILGEVLRNPANINNKGARENLKDLGFVAGSVAGTLKLMEVLGFEVSWDPFSSDFLKVRRGGTVYDPTAGVGKALRTALRVIAYGAGLKEMKYGESIKEEFGKILSDTLSPGLSTPATMITGENLMGMEAKTTERGIFLALPLLVGSFVEGLEEGGMGEAMSSAIPEFFGIGVNRYQSKAVNALGQPATTKATPAQDFVLRELNRLKIEISPLERKDAKTDGTWRGMATAQGAEVAKALFAMMQSQGYKNAVLTEKKEMILQEVKLAKKEFNAEYNEAEREHKDLERSLKIRYEKEKGLR
jgi:hypothetical protein